MKINYLIKATPFLSTLLIIIFLNISNQKEYTRLRLLIWNTPSLTLGKYLAISTGSGFFLSYLVTNSLSRLNQKSLTSLKYKDVENHVVNNDYTDLNQRDTYDNTLIERNLKDPSPTINANFRIIGRMQRDLNSDQYYQSDNSIQFEEQSDEMSEKIDTSYNGNSISNDWNDDSYSRW